MSAFSDQRVIDFIRENFTPVAIDIDKVIYKKDAEGDYFRKVAEQGHYAGRTKPTKTRQGLYVALADGKLLASINSSNADTVLEMMKKAVANLDKMKADGSAIGADLVKKSFKPDSKYATPFPVGGMIVKVTVRDMPRKSDPKFSTTQHNFDYLWLTADEVASFAPAKAKTGEVYEVPTDVIKRIAQFHLLDSVKGETPFWPEDAVKVATAKAKVLSVSGDKVSIILVGQVKCVRKPSGEINPYSGSAVDKEYGVDLRLTGRLIWDSQTKQFTQFNCLAYGDRWGATKYNVRFDDREKNPIGFAFELMPQTPENMTEPKFVNQGYFH